LYDFEICSHVIVIWCSQRGFWSSDCHRWSQFDNIGARWFVR